MKPNHKKQVLAVSVNWQNFGFAMFWGPDDLIDWGTKNFRRGVNAVKIPLEAKLTALLRDHQPDVLVLLKPTTLLRERNTAKITKLAKAKGIPVVLIRTTRVHAAFAPRNQNKYQIAAAIAERYPELLSRLPSPRKGWQSEKFGITIFEAAAAGFVYYGRTITPSEP